MERFTFKEFAKQFKTQDFWKKFFIMMLGIFFMGFFLSFLRAVGWGTDPYTFQNENIRLRLGWSLGNWQLLFNAILFIFVFIFNWRLIGLGTLANFICIGYTADFFNWLWAKVIPDAVFHDPAYLWLKIIIFALAIFFFVISASVYMNAEMGLSPYDGTASILSSWHKKVPFFVIRICYDMFAIFIGILATLGTRTNIRSTLIGSVIMALALGPAITLTGKFMKRCIFK